jgi:hypothetical protein
MTQGIRKGTNSASPAYYKNQATATMVILEQAAMQMKK